MRIFFSLTIFVGSALLFLVQPMIAKLILPAFGGSPAVWVVSMVFFQAALLGGYAYAHLSLRWLGVARQRWLHVAIVALAGLTLPFVIPERLMPSGTEDPALRLLMILAFTVGASFLAISAGAPVLQRWYAASGLADAKDPYWLYSASNLGSMMALLSYPFLLEPTLRLSDQARLWAYGYWALVVLLLACALLLRQPADAAVTEEAEPQPISWTTRGRWLLLSATPVSLLLAITTYLTTNIAPIPLLWVVPLSLYLLTFILAFARKPIASSMLLGRLLPILGTPLVLAIILESSEPLIPLAIFHLSVFFLACWSCHARLAEDRPSAARLTEFYFWLALGGVVGGLFNAIIAPLIFTTLVEYPLALVLAFMLRKAKPGVRPHHFDLLYALAVTALTAGIAMAVVAMGMDPSPQRTVITIGLPAVLAYIMVERPMRYGLSLAGLFIVAAAAGLAQDGIILSSSRSFFGVHRVVATQRENGRFHKLVHGNTLHGMQNVDRSSEPLTYYHRTGPIGQVLSHFSGEQRKSHVGLVGLGVGSLAAYGEPGQRITFFEIDPEVERVAREPKLFTFLRDSKAEVRVVLGDARLSLKREHA
ncbi:MAG TPA: hypothetical protein VEX38_01795, partial [Fimbriimonadaceae bacterium]|nr:hypothetical protein [Fimbriimonadaceae bacterium]